jgi:hypothetical protein
MPSPLMMMFTPALDGLTSVLSMTVNPQSVSILRSSVSTGGSMVRGDPTCCSFISSSMTGNLHPASFFLSLGSGSMGSSLAISFGPAVRMRSASLSESCISRSPMSSPCLPLTTIPSTRLVSVPMIFAVMKTLLSSAKALPVTRICAPTNLPTAVALLASTSPVRFSSCSSRVRASVARSTRMNPG